MQKRPSNAIFYVIGSILILFGIYIGGNLILQAGQEVVPEETIRDDNGLENRIQGTDNF